MTPITALTNEDDIAVITLSNPPVNALSAALRAGIVEAFAQIAATPNLKAVVLMCEGRTFIAGADISEFGKPPIAPGFPEVIAAIENCPLPVTAAIHGTALGGGLETALACHYRIAARSARLGLPEVKLGLLPGAGGTQRLPRAIGAEAALTMVTTGAPITAEKALSLGLIQALIEDDLKPAALAFARTTIGLPLPRLRDDNSRLGGTAQSLAPMFAAFRAKNAKAFRGYDAPEANIRCIEAAVAIPFEQGLQFERDSFEVLMSGLQAKAQQHVFFAERQAAKIEGLDPAIKPQKITSVGIIGAGTMGGGIAMNFLTAGIPVTLIETKQEALDRGVTTIRKNYETSAAKGRFPASEVEARMARLTPSLNMADLAEADLIIEAVYEDMAIKKQIFAALDKIAKPTALLATNTSYLDINEIAAATTRPENVLGLHFFSPANVMRLLEVIRADKTSLQTLATAMGLAKTIGKVAVVSGVGPGFIGNRMLRARQTQAHSLVLEGTTPADIDRVLTDFGFPMGPFQMADLAGLDLGWSAQSSKGETVKDRLCEAGLKGQKTRHGYYIYDEARNRTPSPEALKIIQTFAAEKQIPQRRITDAEILERCLYPMINEAAKLLEENIAQRASDIDIVWINGYGWPPYRGGPMFWAEHDAGRHTIAKALEAMGITPSPRLLSGF